MLALRLFCARKGCQEEYALSASGGQKMVKNMLFYMFSMDAKESEKCAREMKARGIGAVVNPPDERAAQALQKEGLDIYGCIGSFSMRDEDLEEYLAEDAFGQRRRWFGSGCPNEKALWERGFDQISKWKKMGAKGVLADGARFASPCPGNELFLSCFCPRCMEKGAQMGFDMAQMREDVCAWSKTPGMRIPEEWLRFREECTAIYFAEFASRVRAQGMECGSFVFTPCIGQIVGQTEESVRGLDIVAPMIYRQYKSRPGIATLNGEFAGLWQFFEQRGDKDLAEYIGPQFGMYLTDDSADAIWENGFEPETICAEVIMAKVGYGGMIAPIIQLDDDRLAESIECAAASGADAIGFFMYNEEGLKNLPDLGKYL